ncbi:tetratricopeptide repeat protein [Sorangium sp. So ce1128]
MTDNDRTKLKSLAQQGEVRRKNGQYTDAIRLFTEAIEIDDEYAWAYAHRGAAHAALDDWEPCCADFKKALSLNPNYGWAYAHWADAHRSHAIFTLGRADTPAEWRDQHALIDKGIDYFKTAVELSPGSAWTFAHRGAAYTYKYWLEVMERVLPVFAFDRGSPQVPGTRSTEGSDAASQALKDLETACELNPRYAWAHAFKACLLALIAREQPDMKPGLLAARDCLLNAFVLDVNKRLLVDRAIAKLLSCARTFPESVAAGISGVEKDPSDVVSRYFVAVGLKHMNDPLAPVVIAQTRTILESARTEIDTMLRGLDELEGRPGDSSIASMRKRLSVEAIALVAFDPTWSEIRERPLPQGDQRAPRPKNG